VIPAVQARRAHDFSATLCINTHLDFPQYANTAAVAAAVTAIWMDSGVAPLLRDCPGQTGDIELWEAFAKQTGARFVSFIGEVPPAAYAVQVATALTMTPGVVKFMEGPNEPDTAAVNNLTGGLSQAAALAAAAAFMPTLRADARARGLQTIDMSFGQGWTAANNWIGNYGSVGDLAPDCDYANAHTYPMNGAAPLAAIQAIGADAQLAAPGRPVMHTEFGYETSVGLDVQAKQTLAGWCDAFSAGCPLFGVYALYDDGSGAWGMFNADGTARPLATALANLLAILADAGPAAATFTPGSLQYELPGCETILLQLSDGAFLILAWNEATFASGQNPSAELPLTLGQAGNVSVFDPMEGAGPIAPAVTATTVRVSVPAYPVVVRVSLVPA
jgi:hypothetical protein